MGQGESSLSLSGAGGPAETNILSFSPPSQSQTELNIHLVKWTKLSVFSGLNIHPCVAPLDLALRPLRSTRISDSHARYGLHQSQQPEASHWATREGETPQSGALTKPQLQLHHVSESSQLCGWVEAETDYLTRISYFPSCFFCGGLDVFNLHVQLKTAKTEKEFSLSSMARKNDECCCDKWR